MSVATCSTDSLLETILDLREKVVADSQKLHEAEAELRNRLPDRQVIHVRSWQRYGYRNLTVIRDGETLEIVDADTIKAPEPEPEAVAVEANGIIVTAGEPSPLFDLAVGLARAGVGLNVDFSPDDNSGTNNDNGEPF